MIEVLKVGSVIGVIGALGALFISTMFALDWFKANYPTAYEWTAAISAVSMFGIMIAEAFLTIPGWVIGVFLLIAVPWSHAFMWKEDEIYGDSETQKSTSS